MRIQFLLILISDNAQGLAKFMNYHSPFAVSPIAQLLNDDLTSSSFQDTTQMVFQSNALGLPSDWMSRF